MYSMSFESFRVFSSEFCGTANHKVENMVGQLPKADTVDYILEPPPEEELEPGDSVDSDKKKTASSSSSKGGIILFAVDISSSMAVTVDIPELQGTYVQTVCDECSIYLY